MAAPQLSPFLKDIASPELFRRGTHVYFQGEVPRKCCYVLDGVIQSYVIATDGSELLINLYGRGSLLPMAWVTKQASASLFHYHAANDTRVLSFTRGDLYDGLDNNAEFLREYMNTIATSQASLLMRTTGLCQPKAKDKICYALHLLAFRFGLEKSDGTIVIDLPLTQTMLASFIGQTRENTAKTLKVLRDHGIVTYDTGNFVVNQSKLNAALGEDAFQDLT